MLRRAALKRLAQSALLIVVAVTMLGAGTPDTRFDQLGHKLMCTCGCAELLLEDVYKRQAEDDYQGLNIHFRLKPLAPALLLECVRDLLELSLIHI